MMFNSNKSTSFHEHHHFIQRIYLVNIKIMCKYITTLNYFIIFVVSSINRQQTKKENKIFLIISRGVSDKAI